MRHNSQGRRSSGRHRGGGNGGGHNRHGGGNGGRTQVFDSNGPEVRIRGTAHQICEKYMTLAKDAASMGDRVLEESYLQHAEHYQRIINSWQSTAPAQQTTSSESNAPSEKEELGLPASIVGAKQDAAKADASLEDA